MAQLSFMKITATFAGLGRESIMGKTSFCPNIAPFKQETEHVGGAMIRRFYYGASG